MKILNFAGIVFNVNNICAIQKVNMKKETGDESVPGLQIVTVAGSMNFSFETEKERDTTFNGVIAKLKGI